MKTVILFAVSSILSALTHMHTPKASQKHPAYVQAAYRNGITYVWYPVSRKEGNIVTHDCEYLLYQKGRLIGEKHMPCPAKNH